MSESMPTGEQIRKTRESKGLSIHELAERSGLSWATIRSTEEGTHAPLPKTMRAILSALAGLPTWEDLAKGVPNSLDKPKE